MSYMGEVQYVLHKTVQNKCSLVPMFIKKTYELTFADNWYIRINFIRVLTSMKVVHSCSSFNYSTTLYFIYVNSVSIETIEICSSINPLYNLTRQP